MRKKSIISRLVRPVFLPGDSPVFFGSQVYACPVGSSSSTAMWNFPLSPCAPASLSLKPSLLSSQFALNSYFTFIQSVLLTASLISASTRTFDPKVQRRIHFFSLSFHSVVHSFVQKVLVVWTPAACLTWGWGFTCWTKDVFIQFVTSIY